MIDERSILERAISGDENALGYVLHRHSAAVLGYLRQRMPGHYAGVVEPADLLQETFLAAIRNIGSLKARDVDKEFSGWLHGIARHCLISAMRDENRLKRGVGWKRVFATPSSDEGFVTSLLEELAVYERTPSLSAMSHEVVAVIQASMERLPVEHRLAIRLRHVEGLSVAEVASRMNRTEGSVLMLCNRAMKTMREDLRVAALRP